MKSLLSYKYQMNVFKGKRKQNSERLYNDKLNELVLSLEGFSAKLTKAKDNKKIDENNGVQGASAVEDDSEGVDVEKEHENDDHENIGSDDEEREEYEENNKYEKLCSICKHFIPLSEFPFRDKNASRTGERLKTCSTKLYIRNVQ